MLDVEMVFSVLEHGLLTQLSTFSWIEVYQLAWCHKLYLAGINASNIDMVYVP